MVNSNIIRIEGKPCLQNYEIVFLFSVTKVKNDTGVAITIPPDVDNSNIIRIEGEPSGVQRAKDELLKLANKIVS